MTHITCRLTAKNRDRRWKPALRFVIEYALPFLKAYNQIVCCQCRPELESEDYWFGLHKFTAPRGSFSYWSATTWYDGNKSTWRNYARRYPRYRYDTCFRYSKDGWKDKPCDSDYYYTCKQAPGMRRFFRNSVLGEFSVRRFAVIQDEI